MYIHNITSSITISVIQVPVNTFLENYFTIISLFYSSYSYRYCMRPLFSRNLQSLSQENTMIWLLSTEKPRKMG